MRLNYYEFPETVKPDILADHGCTLKDRTLGGVSVTTAKKLLKMYGGSAWTEHIDRNGGCFEVTEIKLTGNNSRFRYNHHL